MTRRSHKVNAPVSSSRRRIISGGGGTDEPPVATGRTPWLPFEMPARDTLQAKSTRVVFAHFFTPFRVRISNKPWNEVSASTGDYTNYEQKYFLPPGRMEPGNTAGSSKDFPTFGGFTRTYPLDQHTRPRTGDWSLFDKADQVRWARNAGIDGFTVDLLSRASSTGGNWPEFVELIDAIEGVGVAAAGKGDFTIVPMPDGTASFCDPSKRAEAVSNLKDVIGRPSIYRRDGKAILMPFAPESAADTGVAATDASITAYWTGIHNDLLSTSDGRTGYDTRQWNCYNANWVGATSRTHPLQDDFSFVIGAGRWGDRDPTNISSTSNQNAGAAAYNRANFTKKLWLHFASPQDTRPDQLKFWEASNSDAYRAAWKVSRESAAEAVQIPTWNDYRESACIEPSNSHGFCLLDITSFYIYWYKYNVAPDIVRDTVYLNHRIHRTDLTKTAFTGKTVNGVKYGPQTKFQGGNGTNADADYGDPLGGTVAQNNVEALCFLTAPATVSINVCGTVHDFPNVQPATDGGPTSVKAPLHVGASGTVSVTLSRGGTNLSGFPLVSPHSVTLTPISQDLTYYYVSSRGNIARVDEA